jgi:tocopherol cyclase
MFRTVKAMLNPAAFHGLGKKAPFFEGWYFKVVDREGRLRYAIIPGIYRSTEPEGSHAFIQVSDGATGQATYQSYPLGQFSSAEDRFAISLGGSSFSTDRFHLDLKAPGLAITGELSFLSPVPWPVTLFSPGVMGWYAWMPFMECYHGVVSMDHGIRGGLTVNGTHRDFTGGRGYTEKDWGRSFPSAWIWMQSNHFPREGTSLTASMAVVPWIGRPFAGFTAGFLHGGRLYRFATYTGATVEDLSLTEGQVSLTIQNREHRLELTAMRTGGSLLRAPTVLSMGRRITETLTSTVEARLLARRAGAWEEIFQGTGIYGGLEAAGDVARLKSMWSSERSGPRAGRCRGLTSLPTAPASRRQGPQPGACRWWPGAS